MTGSRRNFSFTFPSDSIEGQGITSNLNLKEKKKWTEGSRHAAVKPGGPPGDCRHPRAARVAARRPSRIWATSCSSAQMIAPLQSHVALLYKEEPSRSAANRHLDAAALRWWRI